MEPDTIVSDTEANDADQAVVLQAGSSQGSANAHSSALQPQPDGLVMTPEAVVSPTDEKPSPFLRLPAEIRNMIYHDPQVFTAKPFKRRSLGIYCSNLCPPPIAGVNKQMRYEFLPVFYSIVDFTVTLDSPPAWSLDQVQKMLTVFLSPLSNSLQASAFLFVSNLSIATIDKISWRRWNIIEMGFVMSSNPFDSDKLRECEGIVKTEALDWDNWKNVKKAYFRGMDSSAIGRDMRPSLGHWWRICRTCRTLLALMRFVARRCLQLRSHVLVFFKPGHKLLSHVARARQRMVGNG